MSRARFTDQVVFVTGGSSGLGAETCQLFIDEGAKVFVTDLEERGILKRLGHNASYQRCDISNPEDCGIAINACIKKYGRLDVLFNNGARLAPIATVVEHDLTLFQQVVNTNLCGLFYLCRIAIPQMRKQGKGAIIATASTAGLAGDYGLCSYSAAKAGTVNLIKTMALDHAREGIRVNCVCPGYMITPMTVPFREHEALHKDLVEGIPQGRGCDPKEVSRAILFLASDEASYMNGHAMVVDGGWTAHSGAPNFLKWMPPTPDNIYAIGQVAQTNGNSAGEERAVGSELNGGGVNGHNVKEDELSEQRGKGEAADGIATGAESNGTQEVAASA